MMHSHMVMVKDGLDEAKRAHVVSAKSKTGLYPPDPAKTRIADRGYLHSHLVNRPHSRVQKGYSSHE
jgi:hypothetical protein